MKTWAPLAVADQGLEHQDVHDASARLLDAGVGDAAHEREAVAGVERAVEDEFLLAVEQLAPVDVDAGARVVGAQRRGEGGRRRDARVAGGARRRFVHVDGVGVADRLGEAADVAAFDLELERGGLSSDVGREAGFGVVHAASIDLALRRRQAGRSRSHRGCARPPHPRTPSADSTTVAMSDDTCRRARIFQGLRPNAARGNLPTRCGRLRCVRSSCCVQWPCSACSEWPPAPTSSRCRRSSRRKARSPAAKRWSSRATASSRAAVASPSSSASATRPRSSSASSEKINVMTPGGRPQHHRRRHRHLRRRQGVQAGQRLPLHGAGGPARNARQGVQSDGQRQEEVARPRPRRRASFGGSSRQ